MHEQYTIRRKMLRFLGAGFHIYDGSGELVAFCNQKGLRLREDIRLYADETKSEEFLTISTQRIIDFSASYEVRLPTGGPIGMLRRRGMRSMLRDSWLVFDAESRQIGTIVEDSAGLAALRRFIDLASVVFPQRFLLRDEQQNLIATYRQHINPMVYKLGVEIHSEDPRFDDLLVLAGGVLIAAIEGRQG